MSDTFIRNFIPYLVRFDENKNYYMLNRDYVYIGLNCKSSPPDFVQKGEFYMFNDETKPWESKNNFKKMCMKFNDFKSKHSKCLNPNEFNPIRDKVT
jgi:hypothetical protein